MSVLKSFAYGSKINDDVDFIIVGSSSEDLDEYLDDEDELGNSSLIFACLNGNTELVRNLIDQGAFVNHQNQNGETAVYWASSQGNETTLDILIENGANLNICNLDGVSPAHVAAANGHKNIVEKLVRNGAFINAQDETKESVLHYAVREGKIDVVEHLVVNCKARVDLKNEDSESALDLARCLEPMCGQPYDTIVKILQSASNSSSGCTSALGTKFCDEPILIYGRLVY